MGTLKTKTAKSNHVVFNFVQYFAHPPWLNFIII